MQETVNGCAENTVDPGMAAEKEYESCEAKLQKLTEEYARLQQEYAGLQKQSILEKVSHETGCADPDYLEFCAVRQGIAVLDSDALRRFARELAVTSPGCFNARIIPGSSAGNSPETTSPAGNRREVSAGDRIGMIALSIDCAPDAVCR